MKRGVLRARAEDLLEELREKIVEQGEIEGCIKIEMEEVRKRYAKEYSELQTDLKILNKCIMNLMKDNSEEIFAGGDKIKLENGWLLFSRGDKIRIPRDALEKIEGLGWHSLVKIVKSIDREAVEKLPAEDLAKIGAEKKQVEKYAYEIADR